MKRFSWVQAPHSNMVHMDVLPTGRVNVIEGDSLLCGRYLPLTWRVVTRQPRKNRVCKGCAAHA